MRYVGEGKGGHIEKAGCSRKHVLIDEQNRVGAPVFLGTRSRSLPTT